MVNDAVAIILYKSIAELDLGEEITGEAVG
jgi:hypothetical protein